MIEIGNFRYFSDYDRQNCVLLHKNRWCYIHTVMHFLIYSSYNKNYLLNSLLVRPISNFEIWTGCNLCQIWTLAVQDN